MSEDPLHARFEVRPIGIARTPFSDKAEVPRQPGAAGPSTEATITLLPELADATRDLAGVNRIWVLFWFDRASPPGAPRPFPGPTRVTPPRSTAKRGVFATRSPHRPNPIGLSCVRLLSVDGATLRVADLDVLDGTPILDLKPYVAYADAFPDDSPEWIAAPDPGRRFDVSITEDALAQLAFLDDGGALEARARAALALGPAPHAYRRIRERPDGSRVLAVKSWRLVFEADDAAGRVVVTRVESGYKPRELHTGEGEEIARHRAFVARFGEPR